MTDRLFVFDTNTLVSGLLFLNSKPAQALQKAREVGFVVASEETFNELTEVLMRPKFDKYLSLESRQQFLIDYRNAVLFVDILQVVTDCRDPKDNKFLDVVVNANASYLISGDQDLLVLHPYGTVQIITPTDFLLT